MKKKSQPSPLSHLKEKIRIARATEDALGNLHGELVKVFTAKLRSGEYNASDLNVIRQFLKDNSISSLPEAPPMSDLLDEMPDIPSTPEFYAVV